MNEPRVLKLGRPFGAVLVRKSPVEIAALRAQQCETEEGRQLFVDAYQYVRGMVPRTHREPGTGNYVTKGSYLAFEAICDELIRRGNSATEAGVIEALAACRAEGLIS